MLPTKYVLYQNGMMSVLTPLTNLKPVMRVPLEEESDDTLVVEVQLPKRDIDPEKVILLDPRTTLPLSLKKQTNSLQSGFSRIRFYLSNPDVRQRQVLSHAYIYYFDLNPQLEWSAAYHARLDNHMENPNAARISTFSCDLSFRNVSDHKIGPGSFHIMIQQNESPSPRPRPVVYERKRKSMSRSRVPMAAMAAMAAVPESFVEEKKSITPSEAGTPVAEGFLIDLPGVVEFEKSSSTQIQIIEVQDLTVHKTHYCVLEDRIVASFADVKYQFTLPNDSSTSSLLPGGSLDLFSESLEYLGNHVMRPIVVGSEIELMASKDKNVPIQGDISSEMFEVDEDGNKVMVYTGGVMIKNYYEDTKNPLLFVLYVPIQKSVIKIKELQGVRKWEHEVQESRIKFYLHPIPAHEKSIIKFIIYNSDPIKIKNPQRLKVQIAEELKRRILDTHSE